MIAYEYDENKKYIGTVNCQIDQLESKIQGSDVWLLPANSTFKEPLPDKEGFDVIYNNDDWVYIEQPKPQEPTEEDKKTSVRAVREQYFANYVDWYQSKPLIWEEMTDEEKQDIADYRHYLMDYTKQENWWEKNPLNFEEWKNELVD